MNNSPLGHDQAPLFILVKRLIFNMIWLAMVYLMGACQHDPDKNHDPAHRKEVSWTDLINEASWTLVEHSRDPYWSDDQNLCKQSDFGLEYGGLELSTQRCNHATFAQALLHSIKQGDSLFIELWHSSLVSQVESSGLIELSVQGAPLWSKALVIPSPAESWSLEFQSPIDASEGDEILFHVNNHGSNSYNLNALRILSPIP